MSTAQFMFGLTFNGPLFTDIQTSQDSPFLPFFKSFITVLELDLFGMDVLKDINSLETDLDKILFYDTPSISISERIQRFQAGGHIFSTGNIWEQQLDKWLARIENKIDKLNIPIDTKQQYIDRVKFLFTNYYRISGYLKGVKHQNPFYHRAKLLTLKVGDILVKAVPGITKNEYTQINVYLEQFSNVNDLKNFYKDLIMTPKRIPSTIFIEKYRQAILSTFARDITSYLSPSEIIEINKLFDEFKSSVILFTQGQDILSTTPDSIRKNLVQSIIDLSPILQSFTVQKSLYYILFGDFDAEHWILRTTRPPLKDLFIIERRVSQLTIDHFSAEELDITIQDLEKLQMDVREIIKIFCNEHYMHEKLLRKSKKADLQYKLTDAIWLATATHESDPNIDFTKIAKLAETSSLQWKIIMGSGMGYKSLGAYLRILHEFKQSAIDTESLAIYQRAIDYILTYARENKISIFFRSPGTFYDRTHWFEEQTKQFHITRLLARNLGFDILTFKTLDDSIFVYGRDKYGNTFARHHFRDDIDNKLSLYIEDLILTDGRVHNLYRNYDEADILEILEGFETMMSQDGTGQDGKWIQDDVKDLFKDSEWVYELWSENRDFGDLLNNFNERKNFYQSNGLETFIEEYYDIAHERFFNQYGEGVYSLCVRVPGLGDYSGYLNINWRDMFDDSVDYSSMFPKLL
ncbi:hypothetical protein LCGC14_0578610 [marine sediment metagenome]|uniref:Uncharacterized protein n=1 Tax=marine sediment metagenome TaxID=412755 RepID=A0A0F9U3E5_9ZZZZ|nr:hypothetical protein [bacterium]